MTARLPKLSLRLDALLPFLGLAVLAATWGRDLAQVVFLAVVP